MGIFPLKKIIKLGTKQVSAIRRGYLSENWALDARLSTSHVPIRGFIIERLLLFPYSKEAKRVRTFRRRVRKEIPFQRIEYHCLQSFKIVQRRKLFTLEEKV